MVGPTPGFRLGAACSTVDRASRPSNKRSFKSCARPRIILGHRDTDTAHAPGIRQSVHPRSSVGVSQIEPAGRRPNFLGGNVTHCKS